MPVVTFSIFSFIAAMGDNLYEFNYQLGPSFYPMFPFITFIR